MSEDIDLEPGSEGPELVAALAENGVSEPAVYQEAARVDRERELAKIQAELEANRNTSALGSVLQNVDFEELANAVVTLVQAGAQLSQNQENRTGTQRARTSAGPKAQSKAREQVTGSDFSMTDAVTGGPESEPQSES
jgi:hypothetical protein